MLDGILEVRDGDTIVNVLRGGDAFGEMQFLGTRSSLYVRASRSVVGSGREMSAKSM